MRELTEYCRRKYPAHEWDDLDRLDIDTDYNVLRESLSRTLSSEPPGPEIDGFWFGLFNPVLESGEATCGLYICGSDRFDPADQECEWAVNPVYWPDGRYLESTVLSQIYSIAASGTDEVASAGEYVLCLGYACLSVARMCKPGELQALMRSRRTRAVAVGFDSGDSIIVATIPPL
jgi:hypothetical protein